MKAKKKPVKANEESEMPIEVWNTLHTVAQMRKAQTEYFTTKDRSKLIDAKRLEAAVDMRLSTMGIKAI